MTNKKKRLVIFGSSVAFGEGAKNNYGWAALITERFLSMDWEVINKSVCGNRAKNLLRRAHSDVVDLHPDAVIIAISLGNEGLVHAFKKHRYNRFITGIKKLVKLFNESNIYTIVTNVYPNDYYGKTEYDYVQRMNIELDQLNVTVINVSGTVDDLNGKWLKGLAFDPGHPNDLGHYEMSTAFSNHLFSNLGNIGNLYYSKKSFSKHLNQKFHIVASKITSSFTLCFDVCTINDGLIVGIKNNPLITIEEGNIFLKNNEESRLLSDKKETHINLMYHPYLNEVVISVDDSDFHAIQAAIEKVDDIVFYGENVLFENILLYRGRLSKEIVSYIYHKEIFKSGIELFIKSSDYDDSSSKIINAINNESFIEILASN